jgi:hypothetical protein
LQFFHGPLPWVGGPNTTGAGSFQRLISPPFFNFAWKINL